MKQKNKNNHCKKKKRKTKKVNPGVGAQQLSPTARSVLPSKIKGKKKQKTKWTKGVNNLFKAFNGLILISAKTVDPKAGKQKILAFPPNPSKLHAKALHR